MKTVVALGLTGLAIPKKIEKARHIVASMTANVNFTAPSPTLASITATINALETAHIAALGGRMDDTANRRPKEIALDWSLKSLGAYVETIANASPINAKSVVLSAGMNVKGKGGRTLADFNVKVTGNPGEVKLLHHGVHHGAIEFQISTDPSKEGNWMHLYASTRGNIVKSGLISGTRYYFRAAVIDKNGQNPWSSVVNTIVL